MPRLVLCLFALLALPLGAGAIVLAEGDIVVADGGNQAILVVDPVTGDRAIVSGCFESPGVCPVTPVGSGGFGVWHRSMRFPME